MGKLVSKLVQIDEEDKAKLEILAKEKFMSSNQLIRYIINSYIKNEYKENN